MLVEVLGSVVVEVVLGEVVRQRLPLVEVGRPVVISSSNSGSLIPFSSSNSSSVISSSNSSSLTKKRFFLFERVTRGNCYYARAEPSSN